MERIIGRYTGSQPGPLLICIGGIHGNEMAGVNGLTLLFKMLEVEPIRNPAFVFNGRIVGFRGNLRALAAGKRFIQKDLNRQWTQVNIKRVQTDPEETLDEEDLELRDLHAHIMQEIKEYNPTELVLLDIHTTTAMGGIFTLPSHGVDSEKIALELHAPVIRGMLDGIKGTTLHYFTTENIGIKTSAVCFEAGQHYEELSTNRAIAAIINCMRTIGCVNQEDVENVHDEILLEFSKNLPKVSELIYCHDIITEDKFIMNEGYENFQSINSGELLASDIRGQIKCPANGRILMPLYQKQGEEGFFVIREVEGI